MCRYTGRTFRQIKKFSQMLLKNGQKFAKSSNQNICSQTLSKFARFPESGYKFANVATLPQSSWQNSRPTTTIITPTSVSLPKKGFDIIEPQIQ